MSNAYTIPAPRVKVGAKLAHAPGFSLSPDLVSRTRLGATAACGVLHRSWQCLLFEENRTAILRCGNFGL